VVKILSQNSKGKASDDEISHNNKPNISTSTQSGCSISLSSSSSTNYKKKTHLKSNSPSVAQEKRLHPTHGTSNVSVLSETSKLVLFK
jgi:hypothetical protein